MTRPKRLWILLKKELMQLVNDNKMRLTVFGPPIWMVILFGYASTMDLKDCPFAVLDRAHTAETRALTAHLENTSVFVRKADFVDEVDLKRRISEKDVRMGVVFPPDFTHTRQVQVVADGRNTSSAGMAIGYASQNLSKCDKDVGQPRLVVRGWFNPDYDARWFSVPCLLANLLMITLTVLVALSLAREREGGTMDQLHLTPYTPFETLLAKGFSGLFVGTIQALTALCMIFFWFKVPFTGSPLGLVVLLSSFLVSSVGIGLLVSVHSQNLQQATIATIVIVTPLTMLSGVTTPVASMPTVFRFLATINPMRYAVDALQQLFLEGASFQVILFPVCFIAGCGLLAFFVAWNRFRKL